MPIVKNIVVYICKKSQLFTKESVFLTLLNGSCVFLLIFHVIWKNKKQTVITNLRFISAFRNMGGFFNNTVVSVHVLYIIIKLRSKIH